MSTLVPLQDGPLFFDEQILLDGTTYLIQVQWNIEGNVWVMDVLDSSGSNVLVGGIFLRANSVLADSYNSQKPYPGLFVIFDFTNLLGDPGIDNLAAFSLYYLDAADMASYGIGA